MSLQESEMESTTAHRIVFAVLLVLCIAWQVHTQVNCATQGAGRHANTADTTCKNYTLCVYVTANQTFLSYNYVCPTTSVFSPNLAQCTTNYTCPTAG